MNNTDQYTIRAGKFAGMLTLSIGLMCQFCILVLLMHERPELSTGVIVIGTGGSVLLVMGANYYTYARCIEKSVLGQLRAERKAPIDEDE